jgi:hypothetical protein
MSALGQKQTLQHVRVMSALPPKADITRSVANTADEQTQQLSSNFREIKRELVKPRPHA